MTEINDKDFATIVSQLDSYLLDDCLVECVERAIVVLNRYRDVQQVPILDGDEIWNAEEKILEPCGEHEIKIVKDKLEALKSQYKHDEWIN